MKSLCHWVECTVDDIGREHVSRVWIRIAEEIGEGHGWKGVVIVEEAFVKLDHDLKNCPEAEESPWADEARVGYKTALKASAKAALKSGVGV